jgi:hypothetical protein
MLDLLMREKKESWPGSSSLPPGFQNQDLLSLPCLGALSLLAPLKQVAAGKLDLKRRKLKMHWFKFTKDCPRDIIVIIIAQGVGVKSPG